MSRLQPPADRRTLPERWRSVTFAGVALGAEPVSEPHQLGAQQTVIEDFAIENDGPCAVCRVHRLVAIPNVGDPEARSAKRNMRSARALLLVRAAMN